MIAHYPVPCRLPGSLGFRALGRPGRGHRKGYRELLRLHPSPPSASIAWLMGSIAAYMDGICPSTALWFESVAVSASAKMLFQSSCGCRKTDGLKGRGVRSARGRMLVFPLPAAV